MNMKPDIKNLEDIKLLVNTFYSRIREQPLLGPIFEKVIDQKWPEHLDKMYRFWQTVLLSEHTYNGSPFLPHANLPVSAEHFTIWKELFNLTIDELFEGELADNAKWRAATMAEMFLSKIEYSRNNNFKSIQ
jgi:hemoglobin